MRIAINKNEKIFKHSGFWTNPWEDYCTKNNIDFKFVDCYQPDVIERLREFDCLLWHFGQYVYEDMLVARYILNTASGMGLKVFPDFNTAWHFDDKIAETYLLQSVRAPIPVSKMFYTYSDCKNWIENTNVEFPIVAKLRCGSGSHNVKLLRSKSNVKKYAKKMFSGGIKASPSLIFKASSNYRSSKDWETMKKRIKRIPEFLRTLNGAKKFPKEKQYVFFQEFIPNDGYDIKVVVIGDKLSYFCRKIRKGDFRASGGADFYYDNSLITENIIRSAFEISDNLKFQCMGYDYVVDKDTNQGLIVEMSYGFSHTAILGAGGYFDRNGKWNEKPLNVPDEIIKNILKNK